MMTQTCPSCQADNQRAAKFCAKCGTKLVGEASSAGQTLRLQTLLRGRYAIDSLLAQGGMGAVYKVLDQQLFGRTCVVKEMLAYYTTPEEKQDAEHKFQREAQLLATLNHPNIPQVYDYFVEEDRYYLVMQFIDGQDLEARLASQGGRLTEAEVIAHARQMALVLAYIATQQEITHRDIKPANIILETATNQIKLVDFGIAKAQQAGGQTKTMVMGTQGYAPPEQYNGVTESRSDIYALGATLHHLLTGRDPRQHPPFDFPPVRQVLPTVSAELERIINVMLARSLEERPMPDQLRLDLDQLTQTAGSGTGAFASGPFTLRSGTQVVTPEELGTVLDRQWEDGIYHLYAGHLDVWFQGQNRHDLANRCQQIRQTSSDQHAGLEQLVRTLTPTMALPSLQLDQPVLNFGVVERGSTDQLQLTIANQGRGYLHGSIKPLVPWVSVSSEQVGSRKDTPQQVAVLVDTSELTEGQIEMPLLEITTNGGLQNVSAQMMVAWQPQLQVTPQTLDFGDLSANEHGKLVYANLQLTNEGGSILSGNIHATVPWLKVAPPSLTLACGKSVQVRVSADTSQLPPFQTITQSLTITTNGGTQQLPVHIGIRKDWYSREARLSRWLAYGALLLLSLIGWAYATGSIVNHLVADQRLLDSGAKWAWVIAALLLPIALFIVARRFVPQLDELEAYFQRGSSTRVASVQFDQTRQLVLLLTTLATGAVTGASAEFFFNGSILGDRLIFGTLGGLLLAGGLLIPSLRWGAWLAAASGVALIVAAAPIVANGTTIMWAAVGLLLGISCEPLALTQRLGNWFRLLQRPLLVLVLTWLALLAGTTLMLPLMSSMQVTWINTTLRVFPITFIGIGAAWVGWWVLTPPAQTWRQPLQANTAFAVIAIILSLLTYWLSWTWSRIAAPLSLNMMMGMQIVVLGTFVSAVFKRPKLIEASYGRLIRIVSGGIGRIQHLPVSDHLKPLAQVDVNAPFAALTLPIALSICAPLMVGMPLSFGRFITHYSPLLIIAITAYLAVKRQ